MTDTSDPETNPPEPRDYPLLRWLVAGVVVLYGFAKVTGAQFLVPESQLDRPMGEVSGFWLTWYYYGYSPVYKALVAGVEIVGGLLLTSRRYAVLGAVMLAPVLANIVVVDAVYGVGIGPMLIALLLLAGVLGILAPHAGGLWRAAVPPRRGGMRVVPLVGRIVLVALAIGFGYYSRNVTVRAPTPIDGVWDVARADGDLAVVDRVFFELDRAHMVVLRDTSGAYVEHHFEVSGDSVRVWETWLEKGELMLVGSIAGDSIRLASVNPDDPGSLRLIRTRAAETWQP